MKEPCYRISLPDTEPEEEITIFLIRHGETFGNSLGRYIGRRTDEPLSREGIEKLKAVSYPKAEHLFVSPMKRCLETAELLYPGQEMHIIEEIAECDFGSFENKNYKELSGNQEYQCWIDSNGMLPFPGGESRELFRERCLRGFTEIVHYCQIHKIGTAAVVTHGGTIMHIMEQCAHEKRDFYDWHIKNGEALAVRIGGGE